MNHETQAELLAHLTHDQWPTTNSRGGAT